MALIPSQIQNFLATPISKVLIFNGKCNKGSQFTLNIVKKYESIVRTDKDAINLFTQPQRKQEEFYWMISCVLFYYIL